MATIRVLPGAVTAHSLRALVLAATPQPSVTLLRQRDGRQIPAALTPLPYRNVARQITEGEP